VKKVKDDKIFVVDDEHESVTGLSECSNKYLLKVIANLRRENKALQENCEQLEKQIYELLRSRPY
jgi:hypothetical protein